MEREFSTAEIAAIDAEYEALLESDGDDDGTVSAAPPPFGDDGYELAPARVPVEAPARARIDGVALRALGFPRSIRG